MTSVAVICKMLFVLISNKLFEQSLRDARKPIAVPVRR